MEAPAFSFEEVRKRYGDREALRGITFSARAGEVLGLVGVNGAGKSTAIRCLMGLSRPDSGSVRLLGKDPWGMGPGTKQRLGYLSERGVPFPWASARDLKAFCAPLYPHWDPETELRLLQRFRIDPARPLKTLSLGQQRAVGLLLALAPGPEVLVLDEPAANLDPALRRAFLDEIGALAARGGRTVLYSSHILSDVERLSDRLLVLHAGRVILDRRTADLRAELGNANRSLEDFFVDLVGREPA